MKKISKEGPDYNWLCHIGDQYQANPKVKIDGRARKRKVFRSCQMTRGDGHTMIAEPQSLSCSAKDDVKSIDKK